MYLLKKNSPEIVLNMKSNIHDLAGCRSNTALANQPYDILNKLNTLQNPTKSRFITVLINLQRNA